MFKLRLRSLFRRGIVEQELDSELSFHFEKQVEQNIDLGMSPQAARADARRKFGFATQLQEECRDARRMNWFEHLGQDIRYAIRGLRRDPMLALVATLSLAICIGANTTMFSIVDTILLRPLPYPNAARVQWISEILGREMEEVGTGPDYYSLREENRVFEDVGAYDSTTVNWTGVDRPEELEAALATPSFFRVLGTEPLMGRYFAPGEEGSKSPQVVVLSYGFWRSRLASDAQVLGKTLLLHGLPHTVIGVMPQGCDYPRGVQLWKPMDMDEASQRPRLPSRPFRIVSMIARLKPDVTDAQLSSEMARLTTAILAEYPKAFESVGFLKNMRIQAIPLQRRMTGDIRPALLVLSTAVGLVLLIACANLANLLLARGAARQRELAVRMALGSSRSRIVRQVLAESVAFALPGGLIGIALAFAAVQVLNEWQPLILSRYPAISLNTSTLGFSFALTVLTGLVFGMAPAMAAAAVSIQDVLKGAGHASSASKATVRLRQLLVVAELGVALVLLIGAGLLGRSFLKLAKTELGFPPENLLTLKVNLDGNRYAKGPDQVRFYQHVRERVEMLPMVGSAAVSTDLPLSGEQPWSGMAFQVVGRTPIPPNQRPMATVSVVSPEFVRTMGIPLRRGRWFDASDTQKSAPVIVINETLARKLFAGENPIGRRIKAGRDDEPELSTIIGVVGDIRGSDLGADPALLIYNCDCQTDSPFLTRMALIVRTKGDPRAAAHAVEAQIYAVDHDQPVFAVRSMEERLDESLAPRRFELLLIGVFALIAIVLAALGVYGVLSYLVARRTREFGIRVALGARAADVTRLVVRESVVLASLAIGAGVAGAWALTRYLGSLLYGVSAVDGVTFVGMPLLLLVVALVAAFVPASRAARTDPITALREE